MADDPISDSTSDPIPPTSDLPRRKVYESTLFPQRKRRRVSPWIAVPTLLLALLALLYAVLALPHHRRALATAGKVVFVSDQNTPGRSHLWIANVQDGSGAKPLTSGAFTDSDPTFSADGNQIAFLSDRSGGVNQIFLVDADGKNLVQVTRTSGAKAEPHFAPGSNTLLGFLSGGVLAVTDVTKGDADLLLPAPSGSSHPTETSQPEQSPIVVAGYAWLPAKGADTPGLAAVEESSGIQTLALLPDISGPARDTQNGQPGGPPLVAASQMSLAWSPDGSSLVAGLLGVQGVPGGHPTSGLLLLDKGGAPVRLLFAVPDETVGPQNPLYAPDGSVIVVEMWHQRDLASRQRLGLFALPADGSAKPRAIVRGDAADARFLPDSQQFVFLAKRPDGGHDLCRINQDGTGFLRLTAGPGDVSGYDLSPQMPPK